MTRPVRYLLRLLVVVMVMVALVGVGVLWRHSPLASIIAGGDDDHIGDGAAFSLGNLGDLFSTIGIVAGTIAGVVVIDHFRRRRPPIRPRASQ